jgi:hypothetical protein
MGHIVAFGNSAEEAVQHALDARAALVKAVAPPVKRRAPLKAPR